MGLIADQDVSKFDSQNLNSDDGDDLALVAQYVALGRLAKGEGRYERAEAYLRRAGVKPYLLALLEHSVAEDDVKFERAVCLLNLKRVADARTLCDQLAKAKIHDDTDRTRLLNVSVYTCTDTPTRRIPSESSSAL